MVNNNNIYDVIVIGGGAAGLMAAGKAADFLYSPFSLFGVADTFTFFESLGLPLMVQARNRVFPHTEKAFDVLNALKHNNDRLGVKFKSGCAVRKILNLGSLLTGVETNQGIFKAGSYILASGGVSHPETGSTGDGFKWLKDLGHTIYDPKPTIVPLAVSEEWVKQLAGVSLSFMKITFFLEGKKKFSKIGKVLFTHYILNANKNKQLKTVFKEIVPAGTSIAILSLLKDTDFEIKVHSLARDNRKKIVQLLKALPVTITNLMGNDRAVAADGGVALEEIDTKTMRSKIFKNLYVVGDMLHINRPSGGFSLQLCWTTGFVAGNSVA